jgi:hypothetical protein
LTTGSRDGGLGLSMAAGPFVEKHMALMNVKMKKDVDEDDNIFAHHLLAYKQTLRVNVA